MAKIYAEATKKPPLGKRDGFFESDKERRQRIGGSAAGTCQDTKYSQFWEQHNKPISCVFLETTHKIQKNSKKWQKIAKKFGKLNCSQEKIRYCIISEVEL